jgi:AcrR family transcriptional regulator
VPNVSNGDPREEILDAAAALFSTIGYTTTTTRMIAETVGLRQASLFHYFSRKEAILTELLDRTVRPTLELVRRLRVAGLGPEATLWILVHNDTKLLCRGPYNRGALLLLPEARSPQFASFWRLRQKLFTFYRRQLLDGISAGTFPDAVPALAPDMVFSFVESVIIARPSVRANPATPAALADAALRMVGVSPERLATARHQGEAAR